VVIVGEGSIHADSLCRTGAVWLIILYLVFILAPLFALLAGSLPPTRDFWTEFSVALGYSGLAMMGLQFGLTAPFRYVTEPCGEDVIYHFHRQTW
jgi:predicted ferric reductase